MIHGGIRRIDQMEGETAENRSRVIIRLVRYLIPYWPWVLGALTLTMINAGSQAAGPFLIGRAIDKFISHSDPPGLAVNMAILLGVYLVSMLSMRYQIYLMSWAGQRVLADLRSNIIVKIEQLSLRYLEGKEAGDLMSRLVNDIDAISSFLSQGLSQSIGALFSLIGIVIAMLVLHWQLAFAAFAIIPMMILTTSQFSQIARRAFRKTRTTIGDVSADLQEELSGVKVTQAFNRSDLNIKRFAARNAANRDANVSANAVTSAFAPAMDLLSTIDTAVVAGYGGYLAVEGVVSVGLVVAFLQYVQNFFRPIQTVAQIWTLAQSAFAAAERVFELIDTPVEVKDYDDAIEMLSLNGQVEYQDVTFGYDHNHPVLHGIDLTANPGQTIALVGPTGAGKSTLVSLLMRFYDVSSGRIILDGVDVRQVKQVSLRSQMSVVLQEPFLFSGSIEENIRYGRVEASDEEVVEAARIANAHDFIVHLPDGYQTQVGERGGMLSIGQRQLLSIARAILANPRILIFDEATASVDTHTEVLIQQALGRLLKDRTCFVIAHRLSTVRNADQIFVVNEGRIVENGTHKDLIKIGGLYADLYRRQLYTPEELAQTNYALAD
jgi:ATP-binding cassette subfamily B multidrug efflux pump